MPAGPPTLLATPVAVALGPLALVALLGRSGRSGPNLLGPGLAGSSLSRPGLPRLGLPRLRLAGRALGHLTRFFEPLGVRRLAGRLLVRLLLGRLAVGQLVGLLAGL